jgi:hypothetical protein
MSIYRGLKVQSIVEEIKKCIERMQDDRLPKLALKYQPVGK